MFSFHATKLYHSVEGGMLVFPDSGMTRTFDFLKNFGFAGECEVVMPGTNAKMNELQAMMGSLVLRRVDDLIERGRQIEVVYREQLAGVPGLRFCPPLPDDVRPNYSYMPVEVDEREFGVSRDVLVEELRKYNVFARRYFYPLVCDFACYRSVVIKDSLTVARQVASRILTLPTYYDLDLEDVGRICQMIRAIHGRCRRNMSKGMGRGDVAKPKSIV
jgi:dTDP-4-amino-4,6-dideoxygalactose transaminase